MELLTRTDFGSKINFQKLKPNTLELQKVHVFDERLICTYIFVHWEGNQVTFMIRNSFIKWNMILRPHHAYITEKVEVLWFLPICTYLYALTICLFYQVLLCPSQYLDSWIFMPNQMNDHYGSLRNSQQPLSFAPKRNEENQNRTAVNCHDLHMHISSFNQVDFILFLHQ